MQKKVQVWSKKQPVALTHDVQDINTCQTSLGSLFDAISSQQTARVIFQAASYHLIW